MDTEQKPVIGYMYRARGKGFGGMIFPHLQDAIAHATGYLGKDGLSVMEVAEVRMVATVRSREQPVIVEYL